jgi:hypothetical protein
VYPVTTTGGRDTAFIIGRGVKVFGGFSGTETLVSQRMPESYPVVLTGEAGDTSLVNDNVYHVVVVRNTTDSTVLDGLQMQRGYADGPDHTTSSRLPARRAPQPAAPRAAALRELRRPEPRT